MKPSEETFLQTAAGPVCLLSFSGPAV